MSEYTIYVSHTLEDSATADQLKGELTAAGFAITLNVHTVPAGSRPKPALKEAMAGAVRFLACFSSRYGAPTEYEEDEVSWAIEQSAGRAAGEPWLIPVKLTACDIPPLQMADGNLSEMAAVDLYRDWAAGVARLLASLPARAVAMEAAPSPNPLTIPGPQHDVAIEKAHTKRLEITNVTGEVGSGPAGRMLTRIREATADEILKLTNHDNKR